jgi:Zn-dependent peptidase ImmA (M78 family)
MAKQSEMPINPKILIWARETLNLTIEEAAKKIGFELQDLEILENGSEMPSYPQLRKIGNAYKRPTGVFFFDEAPVEPGPPKDFRVLTGRAALQLAPSTLVAIRGVRRRREQALELAEEQNLIVLEFKSSISLKDDPEVAATKWRNYFGLNATTRFTNDHHALRTWKAALEELGVLIFQESLESLEELRGLAIYNELLPCILLNTKDSVRGRIFSLLHEFCHLLLKTSGIGNMSIADRLSSTESQIEVFCNAFAGAMMVPKDLLLADTAVRRSSKSNPIKQSEVIRLTNKFQASTEVVLRRLMTFEKITQADYEDYHKKVEEYFKNRPKKKRDDVIIPQSRIAITRNGVPFTELVLTSLNSGVLTEAKAAKFLGVKPKHIPKIKQATFNHRDE